MEHEEALANIRLPRAVWITILLAVLVPLSSLFAWEAGVAYEREQTAVAFAGKVWVEFPSVYDAFGAAISGSTIRFGRGTWEIGAPLVVRGQSITIRDGHFTAKPGYEGPIIWFKSDPQEVP